MAMLQVHQPVALVLLLSVAINAVDRVPVEKFVNDQYPLGGK